MEYKWGRQGGFVVDTINNLILFFSGTKLKFVYSTILGVVTTIMTFIMGDITKGARTGMEGLIILMVLDFITRIYSFSNLNRGENESLWQGFKNARAKGIIQSKKGRVKTFKKSIQYFIVIIGASQLIKIMKSDPFCLNGMADAFLLFVIFKFCFMEFISILENLNNKEFDDIGSMAGDIFNILRPRVKGSTFQEDKPKKDNSGDTGGNN